MPRWSSSVWSVGRPEEFTQGTTTLVVVARGNPERLKKSVTNHPARNPLTVGAMIDELCRDDIDQFERMLRDIGILRASKSALVGVVSLRQS